MDDCNLIDSETLTSEYFDGTLYCSGDNHIPDLVLHDGIVGHEEIVEEEVIEEGVVSFGEIELLEQDQMTYTQEIYNPRACIDYNRFDEEDRSKMTELLEDLPLIEYTCDYIDPITEEEIRNANPQHLEFLSLPSDDGTDFLDALGGSLRYEHHFVSELNYYCYCNLCQRSYNNWRCYEYHVMKCHMKWAPYSCPLCLQKFCTIEEAYLHRENQHSEAEMWRIEEEYDEQREATLDKFINRLYILIKFKLKEGSMTKNRMERFRRVAMEQAKRLDRFQFSNVQIIQLTPVKKDAWTQTPSTYPVSTLKDFLEDMKVSDSCVYYNGHNYPLENPPRLNTFVPRTKKVPVVTGDGFRAYASGSLFYERTYKKKNTQTAVQTSDKRQPNDKQAGTREATIQQKPVVYGTDQSYYVVD